MDKYNPKMREIIEMLDKDRKVVFWGALDRIDKFLLCSGIDDNRIAFIVNKDKKMQKIGYSYILGGERHNIIDPNDIDKDIAKYCLWVICTSDYLSLVSFLIETFGVPSDSVIHFSDKQAVEAFPRWELATISMLRLEALYRNKAIESSRLQMLNNKNAELFIIPRASVILTTKCSYRCKDCVNMIPYYKYKDMTQEDVPIESILRDINNILNACDEWTVCELIGGEPFVYKQIYDVLEFVLNQDRIKNVFVGTNGTIIPQIEVINLLKHEKVTVLLTDYGDEKTINRFIEAMVTNGVRIDVRKMEWIPPGGPEERGRKVRELKNQYLECPGGVQCKAIYRGTIYACVRSMALHDLGFLDVAWDKLDITSNMKERLLDFYSRDYCIACNHCDLYSYNFSRCKAGIQETLG